MCLLAVVWFVEVEEGNIFVRFVNICPYVFLRGNLASRTEFQDLPVVAMSRMKGEAPARGQAKAMGLEPKKEDWPLKLTILGPVLQKAQAM